MSDSPPVKSPVLISGTTSTLMAPLTRLTLFGGPFRLSLAYSPARAKGWPISAMI